jgi:hypothetical protein
VTARKDGQRSNRTVLSPGHEPAETGNVSLVLRTSELSQHASIGGALTIPPSAQLALMRETAKRDGTLKDLHKALTALEAVAAKCTVAHEELVRLAVTRLEVERDLGAQLAQTVRQGRPSRKVARGDLSSGLQLPHGISKHQARAYRALALIPEEQFLAYLASAQQKQRVPSAAGARRFVAPKGPKVRRTKSNKRPHQKDALELPAAVYDAISRIITPDVCVGPAKLAAKDNFAAEANDALDRLRGDVVVLDCPDPATWLAELRRRRSRGQVQQAIAVLPAEVWTEWFRDLREAEWSLCFVTGAQTSADAGILVAHLGARASAFRIALANIGVVM